MGIVLSVAEIEPFSANLDRNFIKMHHVLSFAVYFAILIVGWHPSMAAILHCFRLTA